MWVARHKDYNKLSLFDEKPSRGCRNGNGSSSYWRGFNGWEGFELDSSLFPDLKWEDKPVEIYLSVKNIDEKKLDELANNAYPFEDEAHWNCYQSKLQEAYKAGYRKAKEESEKTQ